MALRAQGWHALLRTAGLGRLASLRAAIDPAAKGRAARTFRAMNTGAVSLGLAAVVLGTVPDLAAAHGTVLTATALLVSAAFALEYALRLRLLLGSQAERPPVDAFGEPVLPEEEGAAAHLGQLASPLAIIDLVAAFGVPVALLAGLEPPMARLLGLVWILKPVRYSPALAMLARVGAAGARAAPRRAHRLPHHAAARRDRCLPARARRAAWRRSAASPPPCGGP